MAFSAEIAPLERFRRQKAAAQKFLLRSGSIPDIAPLPVMHIH